MLRKYTNSETNANAVFSAKKIIASIKNARNANSARNAAFLREMQCFQQRKALFQ
jgi:hypothetical protein